ncbi:MAG TPA: Ig-like domain-containing protein [Planctomycetota bacterium]|nr:Ig-like domain-containing protein [Planctomycetota bacterium]
MKTSLLLLAVVCIGVSADARAAFYLAPDGKDENPGTIDKPFGSLEKLVSVLVPGGHGYVRGGVYKISRAAKWGNIIDIAGVKGTAAQPITIENYPCEKPIFDFKDSSYTGSGAVAIRFIYVEYLRVKGLRFTGFAQNPAGGSTCGLSVLESRHNIFENLEIDHIGGYGIQLGNGADDNLFLNCDTHHIDDRHTGWRNANGFNITGGVKAERNVFDGCRAWFCSDDGFDFFSTDSFVTIKNCWAFWNGYEEAADGSRIPRGDGQGFKLGPHIKRSPPAVDPDFSKTVLRVLTNNLAFENKECGFDQNSGRMVYQLSGNTSFGNGGNGFWFSEYREVSNHVQNNIAFGDAQEPFFLTNKGENNSWNRAVPLTAKDFQSLSSVGMDGPRGADGSLPNLPFLKLVAKTAPPVIKNQSASGTLDVAFAYAVMAENDPGEYAASGLPRGLAINSATGKITGTPTARGDYTSTVTAKNAAGEASATLTISISGNSAPVVSLTSPVDKTTSVAPASITLSVDATDSDGSVAKVEFYDGSTLVATDMTAPYGCTISNVAVGNHVYSAIAYDNSGNMSYSKTSTVTVK